MSCSHGTDILVYKFLGCSILNECMRNIFFMKRMASFSRSRQMQDIAEEMDQLLAEKRTNLCAKNKKRKLGAVTVNERSLKELENECMTLIDHKSSSTLCKLEIELEDECMLLQNAKGPKPTCKSQTRSQVSEPATTQDGMTEWGPMTSSQVYYDTINSIEEEFNELRDALYSRTGSRQTFIESSDMEWARHIALVETNYTKGLRSILESSNFVDRCEKLIGCCGDSCHRHEIHITILGMGVQHHSVKSCVQTPVDLIAAGLWPISVTKMTFMTFEHMQLLSSIQNFSPSTSLRSIVHALNFNSQANKLLTLVRPEAFNASMKIWRRMEFIRIKKAVRNCPFICPTCVDRPHTVHIDGNSKLYRYSSAGRGSTSQSPDETLTELFVDPELVQNQVDVLRQHKVTVDNNCGDSVWRAAKIVGRKFAKKDETGVMIATCRHSVILKALDMYRGEIYEYPYLLQKEFHSAEFIAMDTICKYWPWLQQIDPPLAEQHKPFLSVMHAKGHEWRCQMKWSGKNTPGAAESTGETTEQANSYLSRLGLTTRHMTKAGRRERITQAAAFWNVRKFLGIPGSISRNILRVQEKVRLLELEVKEECNKLGKTVIDFEIVAANLRQLSQERRTPIQRKIEKKSSSIHQLKAAILKAADGSKSRDVLRCKLREQYKEVRELINSYCLENPEENGEEMFSRVDTMLFPWCVDEQTGSITPSVISALEVWQSHERAKEELLVLKKERNQLLRYIDRTAVGDEFEEDASVLAMVATLCRQYFFNEEEFTYNSSDEDGGSSSDEEEEQDEDDHDYEDQPTNVS